MGDQTDYIFERYFDQDEDLGEEEPKTCRKCGKGMLTWLKTARGWRLSEDGEKVHVCDLFEVIEKD